MADSLEAKRAAQAAAREALAQRVDLDDPPPHVRTLAIAACEFCDDDGYVSGHVCDHVDHKGAAQRGMQLVRAALAKTTKGSES